MRGFALSLLSLLPVAACRIGDVETTPLRGPVPRAVLVLPPNDRTGIPGRDLRGVAFGADRAVTERGYRSLPLDIGFDLARKYGFRLDGEEDTAALRRLEQQAGVDAVLVIHVMQWDVEADVRPVSASWDLSWELVAAESGALLWEHRQRGSWHRQEPGPVDPTRQFGAEPEVVPVGGLGPRDYGSPQELALALNRAAMARLPHRVQ